MKTLDTISRTCPVCDSGEHHPVPRYSHPEWPLVRCRRCDFVYLERAPKDQALAEDLAWEKTSAKEATRRKQHWIYRLDYATRFRLKIGNALDRHFVMRTVASGGKVLDVGCGGSCRIADGLVPFGIEISKGLAQRADPIYRQRGGYVVNSPAIEGFDRFDDNLFDHAILRSYLEHELRPRLALEKLHAKLKRGGTAAIKVPDFGCIGRRVMGSRWCGFRFPDHQNYFTRDSLTKIARATGFDYSFSNVVPGFNDNLYAVLRKPA